jgi:intein-encoded DNA endonuclease-like protein
MWYKSDENSQKIKKRLGYLPICLGVYISESSISMLESDI